MAVFRWRHFAGEIILWAVRWYCRYGISYRELEEMMGEPGVAVDHCNSECVGIHVDKSANRFHALEPVRHGVRQHFGAIGKNVAAGLKLRHDHGSSYKARADQQSVIDLAACSCLSHNRGAVHRYLRLTTKGSSY